MTENENERAVIVTTEFKGVFFGFTADTAGETIVLKNARCVMYWNTGGWMGLAEKGPDKECRISATAPRMEVRKITAVTDVTEEAIKAWQTAPIYKSR